MPSYTRGMSNRPADTDRPISSPAPQQPAPSTYRPVSSPSSAYLDPASPYHPARLARALGLALALLLGAALLTGGLGHPLEVNGLIAPLDGMPATSPERTAAELDRDTDGSSPAAPARPLVPTNNAADPDSVEPGGPASTLLLPEDAVSPSPLQPADAAPAVSPASLPSAAADAYPTFARVPTGGTPTRNLSNLSHDVVRAGRPAAFPDGTPLLARPSHRTGLPTTPREAAPAPTPATDHLTPSSKSTPKPAPLPGIPPLWEMSSTLSKA